MDQRVVRLPGRLVIDGSRWGERRVENICLGIMRSGIVVRAEPELSTEEVNCPASIQSGRRHALEVIPVLRLHQVQANSDLVLYSVSWVARVIAAPPVRAPHAAISSVRL